MLSMDTVATASSVLHAKKIGATRLAGLRRIRRVRSAKIQVLGIAISTDTVPKALSVPHATR